MSEARMQEALEYKPGTFCWVELGTTDSAVAKNFYTQLFGWDYEDHPMGPDGVYTMLKLDGKEVGALYELRPDMKAQGIPPHWLSYISVANVNESAEKAKAEGATILQGPFDVMTVGRMAIVQDPTGAVFALWQPREHKGAQLYNLPNSFCWNELTTPDTTKAGDFYTSVFGWEKTERDMGRMIYTTFLNDGRPNGGMFAPTPEMGNIPPHWLVYYGVADADATVAKAQSLGGSVAVPAWDVKGVGRIAILKDPTGAVFAIIKGDPQQ